MRVTTQMVQQSAIKAGVSPRQTSLLNYINQGGQGNALINAIAKKNTQTGAIHGLQRKNYEKLEESASGLKDSLNEISKDNIKSASQMVDVFNDTVDLLKADGNALNRFYAESMLDLVREHKDVLAKVGIQLDQNNELSVNQEILKKADAESLDAAFGDKAEFKEKLMFLADRIADNAETNLANVSGQYTQNGDLHSQMLTGKFDSRG